MNDLIRKYALGACVALLVLGRLAQGPADPDLWGYLSFGRFFWETGRLPVHDPFSYMPTHAPWIFHEWLTGVLFFLWHKATGPAGLQALRYFLALGALGFTWATARQRGGNPGSIAVCLIATLPLFSFGYSPVRAAAFTYFFVALTLYMLEHMGSGQSRKVWLFGVLGLVWANLHGGFTAGLGLILLLCLGSAVSGKPWKAFGVAAGIFFMGTLINPYFLDLWPAVLKSGTAPWPEIVEWSSVFQAVTQPDLAGLYMLLAGLVAGVIILAVRYELPFGPAMVLAACTYLAFSHVRHIVLFALAFGAYAPPCLTAFGKEIIPRKDSGTFTSLFPHLKTVALVGITLTSCALFITGFVQGKPLALTTPASETASLQDRRFYYPTGAMTFLASQNGEGRILADYAWGSYLTWHLYPAYKVAVDGRTDTVFPEFVHEGYLAFRQGTPGWRLFLEEYPHELVLVSAFSTISTLLEESFQWKIVYQDAGSRLFLRHENGVAGVLHPEIAGATIENQTERR